MKLSNRGLTLAELLLACAIFAFALSGLLALFINCIFLNEGNRNLSAAIAHAQYVLEDIKNINFANAVETRINNNNGTPAGWDLNTNEVQAVYNLGPLTNERISTSVIQAGNPLGVLVRVDWDDHGRRARNIELTTVITDR